MRRLLYVLSVLTVVWATFAVPMPVVEIAPGAAPPIAPLVEIADEQPITAINGNLHLLTVSLGSPSAAEVVRARLDARRTLTSRSNVIPEGVDPDIYFERQRRTFALSFDIAAAVGARTAGFEVEARTAPVVGDVLPDGPAQGVLQPEDIVLEIDGVRLESGQQLAEATATFDMGAIIPLRIERASERLDVEVTAGQTARMSRPGLGITVGDTLLGVDLPFEIDLGPTRIGGPSAGMMIALTVYDLLAEEDLAAGRIVAGTGTVRLDGSVGTISGIPEKVAAAERIGADVMLVPAVLEDEALGARTDPDLRIIGVRTIDEALAALRT